MSAQGTITFVPSVHFSPTHRQRVRTTIRETEPDIVAVELDDRRYDRLERDSRLDPSELTQELPPVTAAAYSVLRAIQRTVVRLYGLDPGRTDMEAAIETAAEREIDIALIDEPITELIPALSARIGPELLPKLFIRAQQLDPSQQARQFEMMPVPLEEITSGEDVEPAIEQMRLLLPELTDVLLDRRDRAMAARLHALRCAGHDIVAIIGAGHHLGIQRALDDLESQDADQSVTVPIRSPSRSVTRIPID